MLNLFKMRNCMIISFLLNVTILSTSDSYTPKLRKRRSVPVDEGIKNDRSLLEMQWSDIIEKFDLNADANPELLEISNKNTIDCDGEMISVDINNLQPVPVYFSGAHCIHDGIDEHCHTEATTTYTGSTSDGQQFIVTFDSESNVRTIDCGECHMEKIFPRLMAKICEDDTTDLENENDIFLDDDETIPDDQERKLLSTLMEKYGNSTSISAIGDGDIHGKSRSLNSDYCATFKQTKVAIAFDSTFCLEEGSYDNAVSEVQNIVARTSIAFESQGLCIQVVISHIDGHCDESTDPYRDGILTDDIGCDAGSDGLMQHFKPFVTTKPEFINADATHLFYHKKLTLTAQTKGCANWNKLCNTAYGVNDMSFNSGEQKRGYLFAHELGHNFGMVHHLHFDGKKAIMRGAPGSGIHYWHPDDLIDFETVLGYTHIQECLTEVVNTIPASPTEPSPAPPTVPTPTTPSPITPPASSPTFYISPSEDFQTVSCAIFMTETFDNGWSNGNTQTFIDYGKMLGRWYYDNQSNTNQGSSKTFDISDVADADEIKITFMLFEFDIWEGDENAEVIVNGKRIELGAFKNNNADHVELSRSGNVDGISWILEPDQDKLFILDGGHQNQKDQIHFVTITVPRDVYIQSENIILEFSFTFDGNKNQESAGITNLVMEACSE